MREFEEKNRTAAANRQPSGAVGSSKYGPAEGARRRRKNKKSEQERLSVFYAAALSLALIAVFSILTICLPDRSVSEEENRELAQRPQIGSVSVADGRFMKETERWLSDQFLARSLFVRMKTATDVFFGKSEVNGMYIGKKHFLISKPAAYDEKRVNETLASINGFALAHPQIRSYLALAPNACEVLPELMPKTAPAAHQAEQIAQICSMIDPHTACLDICTPLKNAENREQLYYRTDHHWTTSAATLAFLNIAGAMGLDTSAVPYITYPIANDFRGTGASAAVLYNAKDTISITVPDAQPPYLVNYVSEGRVTTSVFDVSKLETKNKYEVFFGGNYGQIDIEMPISDGRILMIVKDSYANCMIPMLLPYFKTVVVVDPRYNREDIEHIVQREGVTDVLWLYNVNTFLNDTSIAKTFR